MSKKQIRSVQRGLNWFTKTYLRGLGPVKVDGVLGASTRGRIRTVKYYLGYRTPEGSNQLSSRPDHDFRSRLWHPKSVRYSTPGRIARGARRRRKQRREAQQHHVTAAKASGVSSYNGRACATWMVPYMVWARAHGWRGTLVSGWRDPNYSRSLCYRMCGAPSCAGRCAGTSSNHSGSVRPKGALDVSDYGTFGHLMRSCPLSPRIWNGLGARDPVHFSASGN